MLIYSLKNDSSFKLLKDDDKLKEHSENVLGSEPCLDSQRSVERELAVSCKESFIACSSRIAVELLLGTFSPVVHGFDYLNGKNNILLERSENVLQSGQK
ncbi:hypothetical protein QL285_093583 [Trifolium repens]|nr:hypothetical protein QL285_093583 [Trifolium repens]